MNIIKWFNLLCFYLKEQQCKGSPRMLQSRKVYHAKGIIFASLQFNLYLNEWISHWMKKSKLLFVPQSYLFLKKKMIEYTVTRNETFAFTK